MPYTIQRTKTSRYALVDSAGKLVHPFESEFAAQTACDAMNRSAYEPTKDPYAVPRGRWDQKRKDKAA